MYPDQLFNEALCEPAHAIAYLVSRRLAGLFPGRAIVETGDYDFRLEEYAQAGLCTLDADRSIHNQYSTTWIRDRGVVTKAANAWFEVAWRGHALDVVVMDWDDGCYPRYWILAETREIAEAFFSTVCSWKPEIEGAVLVFDGGFWTKSEGLHQAIRGATFENLVLGGSLKNDLRDDLERFFASQGLYDAHGIPWKRGILLIGPPGNGKTHAVKALINAARQPCLYVKSFASEERVESTNIRLVFDRARRMAPCILVLEDLDSLVNADNRSFLLNELDGFAANRGVVILATTNHPETLDPAILDRPSRFDRKYHFGPPGPAERIAYIAHLNNAMQPSLHLSDDARARVAQATDGFSFAYLKELFLSSMMTWISAAYDDTMESVMTAQAVVLRAEMDGARAAKPAHQDEAETS